DGCLHDERYITTVCRLVEVLELLARELLVPAEVEVSAVVHSLHFLKAERPAEVELDVHCRTSVVRQFIRTVRVELQAAAVQSQRFVPLHPFCTPVLEPLHVITVGIHEELHFHLLELPGSEDEIAWSDLVAERLSDLCNSERHFLARGLLHVHEVHEYSLRGFRAQVHGGG